MGITLGILAFMVAVLAVLQGWSLKRKANNNPNGIISRLDKIVAQLGKMEQRLNDIWDKVNK